MGSVYNCLRISETLKHKKLRFGESEKEKRPDPVRNLVFFNL
jgi:hypothetical protein